MRRIAIVLSAAAAVALGAAIPAMTLGVSGSALAATTTTASTTTTTSTTPTAATGTATNVTATTATVSGTVNAAGQTLNPLTTGSGCYFAYGTSTGSLTSETACTPSGSTITGTSTNTSVTGALSGLTAGTQYFYNATIAYLGVLIILPIEPETAAGTPESFTTAPVAGSPGAETLPASNVTATTAQLNGVANANGTTLTSCTFKYGTSATSLTSTANCSPAPSGTGDTNVSANVTGLTTGTTYYFELTDANATETGTGGVYSFEATAGPTVTNPAATAIGNTTATVGATVDADGQKVTCTVNYGTSTSYGSSAPCSPTPSGTSAAVTSAALTKLTPGTEYHYQVVVNNGTTNYSSSDATFTTLVVTTGTTGLISSSTATLAGSVNPEGQTVTGCYFIYGTSASTLKEANCAQSPSSLTGSSAVEVSAGLSGLTPNTEYGDTLVITTSGGGSAVGTAVDFKTLATPLATTVKETALTSTTATLHGTVNAEGGAVIACEFEYGVTAFGYGSTGLDAACSPTPGSTGTTNVSIALKGLAPGTTYFYRVLFATDGGDAVGSTLSFKTPATKVKKPGVRITKSTISKHARSAKFAWKRTGSYAATKAQCSLASVKHGKVQKHSFKSCKSPKTYKHLAAKTYVFYVRLGNSAGWGSAKSHRFTI